MKNETIASVLAPVLAALLFVTPPAGAATKKAKHRKTVSAQAGRLMSTGLGDLRRGEYTAAISAFTKAARAQGSVSAYFLLGWAHYQRGFRGGSVAGADRDDAQSAIDAYGLALGLDPKLGELPDPSRLYFSLALCREAVGSYPAALDAYRTALRVSPRNALIPLHAARLRLKMRDPAQALSNVELALAKARSAGREQALIDAVRADRSFAPLLADAATRRLLGVSAEDGTLVADARGEDLRDAARDVPARVAPPAQDTAALERISQGDLEFEFRRYRNAVADYDQALALDRRQGTLPASRVAAVYQKIGAAYNKLGQSDLSIAFLRKSLQMNPMNAQTHYQIALGYAMSGQTEAALHALKESLSSADGSAQLRRLVLLTKTDVELEAVRDLPGYAQVMADVADRVALR